MSLLSPIRSISLCTHCGPKQLNWVSPYIVPNAIPNVTSHSSSLVLLSSYFLLSSLLLLSSQLHEVSTIVHALINPEDETAKAELEARAKSSHVPSYRARDHVIREA